MSGKATFWVWTLEIGSSAQKYVLLYLANCHNKDTGRCFPAIDTIARATELNRKTVIKALAKLEEAGYLSVTKVAGRVNYYCLHIGSTGQTSPKNGTGVKSGTTPSTSIGTQPVPNSVHKPKTNLEKESKKNRKTRDISLREQLTDRSWADGI